MDLIDSLKTGAAIAGSVMGITGGAFALGSSIGRSAVESRLEAHLAPETIHPEAAKRISELRVDIHQAQAAAQDAATESRLTRQALEQLLEDRRRARGER